MLETLVYWLVGIGLAFDLFGTIGLVRLPDVYNRAQAATKCVTLGTCMILLGVAVAAFGGAVGPGVNWPMAVKALICAAFILLTSPVGAHAICRGAYISGVPLWEGSVEDKFADRAKTIRQDQAKEGTVQGEEAETS
jgi:multicomponent Na+:H+ antiporter subunit G